MSFAMNQQQLAKEVLQSLSDPCVDLDGVSRLTLEQAQEIVDSTTEYVRQYGNEVEYNYLSAHRKRLAESLSWIPLAPNQHASCIDIGCFGYMGFWAKIYLGYQDIVGVEYHSDRSTVTSQELIVVNDESVSIKMYNLDLSSVDWAIQGTYDTVLFFETLEHVCTDPVGIMANIGKLMNAESYLVMSVPNCISYKTLREFICGTPPWMYWFFHPDLSHEARHCFEYTPFILKTLLRASGFQEIAFRTLLAFSEESDLAAEYAIAQSLSINPRLFGDVILTVAKKVASEPPIRYPCCIYDADTYYKEVWPILWPVLEHSYQHFFEIIKPKKAFLDDDTEIESVGSLQMAEGSGQQDHQSSSNVVSMKQETDQTTNISPFSNHNDYEMINPPELPENSLEKDMHILDLIRELGNLRRQLLEIERINSAKLDRRLWRLLSRIKTKTLNIVRRRK
jgi:hypothetical protein